MSRTRHRVAVIALLAGAVAPMIHATDAHARQRPYAVFLGLRTLGLQDNEAAELTSTTQRSLQAGKHYKVEAKIDPQLNERCQGDVRCYCRETRRHHASHLIYGNVGRIEAIYSFELVLVDTQDCSVDNTIFVTEALAGERADERVSALTEKLLTPPEEVSKTAAKVELPVDSVPAIVTVVTRKQLDQLGVNTLPRLMQMVPGFEVVDTNWGDIVLHHGLVSTVLYMVDGVPLSNPRSNFATLGKDVQLSINDIERVELVRGPGSVLWGQNAFLGIVNLITHQPKGKDPQARAHLRLGSQDTQEFHASIGANRGWFGYYVGTTFRRTDGPQTRVDQSLFATDVDDGSGNTVDVWGNAGTTDNQSDRYVDVVAKLKLIERLEFLFRYADTDTRYEISPFGALLPTAEDHGFWQTTDILYALSWTDTIVSSLTYRLSASRYEHRSWENFVVYPKSTQLPFGFSSLQGNEVEPEVNHMLEGRLHHTFQRGRFANRALVGLSFLHQRMPNQLATLTTGQAEGTESLDIAENNFVTVSAFAQDDLSFFDELLLVSGGLRFDEHDPFKSALSLQGALIAGVPRLRGKLVYTEGFRAPTMNSLFSTTGLKGNPGLRPEGSHAISGDLRTAWGPLSLRAGGTWARMTDLIANQPTSDPALNQQGFLTVAVNRCSSLDAVSVYGEVRLSTKRLDSFVNYTFKHLSWDFEPNRCPDEPEPNEIPTAAHTAAAGFSLRPLTDVNLFATGSLVGPREVRVELPPPVGLAKTTPRAQVLIDVGFTISNLLSGLDVTVSVRNPARISHRNPYQLDGDATPLLERRRDTEAMLTLSWDGRLPWPRN